ncbi:MAG: hypothetical protein O2797_03525, partial [Bacteroidetes bacterium]|nr:hypothetical protein [Bacteroidota bacterium]
IAITPGGERVWFPASRTGTKIVSASLDPITGWEPRIEIDSTFMVVDEIVFRPDGRQVVVNGRTESDRGLWLFDMEKGFIRLMNKYDAYLSPRFSPSGELLAYGEGFGGEKRQLFVEHLTNGTFWEVDIPLVRQVEWDPDGNWLYVLGVNSRLFRIPIDLSTGFRVTGPPEQMGTGSYYGIALHPDGSGFIGSRYPSEQANLVEQIHFIAGFPEWLEQGMTTLERAR